MYPKVSGQLSLTFTKLRPELYGGVPPMHRMHDPEKCLYDRDDRGGPCVDYLDE